MSVPVQVYLTSEDRRTLERLAEHLDISMSDVLRKALSAYEQSMLSPHRHPSLRIIGIAGKARAKPGEDAAVEHDRILTDGIADATMAQRRPGRKRAR